ncbi:hypothetical protein V8G54_001335 [Vigna mungo]|uniref:Uncharacterized protein n=1 Tax=Vigna mungo TaxID=3915 RepID=A0AAQ3P862_VIGMU
MKNWTLHANKFIKGNIFCSISIIQTIKHLFNMCLKSCSLHLPPCSNIFSISPNYLACTCNSLCSTSIFNIPITICISISLYRWSSSHSSTISVHFIFSISILTPNFSQMPKVISQRSGPKKNEDNTCRK